MVENTIKYTNTCFGDGLKKWRGNTPQGLVAKKIGVSRYTYLKWEKGESFPDYELLPKIAAALGIKRSAIEKLYVQGKEVRHSQMREAGQAVTSRRGHRPRRGPEDQSSFGYLFAHKRELLGKSQKEMAELIGATVQAISTWENNHCAPDAPYMQRISVVFKLKKNEIRQWGAASRLLPARPPRAQKTFGPAEPAGST